MTDASKLYRVRMAAVKFGVNYKTLHDAVRHNRIPFEATACGLPLITADVVRQFIRHRPKRGRPPRKHT